jgi:hypothetical protein
MHKPLRVAATLLVLLAGAENADASRLIVRTFDLTGLTGKEMSAAQAAAGGILREAGLDLVWRDCSTGCPDSSDERHIMIRIAQAPRSAAIGSLGYSVVDIGAESGTLATVFADRIRSTALRARVRMPLLLGRAIAHEIGHLLLGTSRHASTGLMRAFWSDEELRRDAPADWILSADVAAEVGRRVDARIGAVQEMRIASR